MSFPLRDFIIKRKFDWLINRPENINAEHGGGKLHALMKDFPLSIKL